MRWILLCSSIVLAAGCSAPAEATWPTGFGYGWSGFNHRLSFAHFGLDGDEAVVGVVGGTSTTGVEPVLPDGCDADTCDEFPVRDQAEVHVAWARVASKRVGFGRGVAAIVADADGETTRLVVPLERRARGEASAWITGLTVDTDHAPEGGEACYDPALGWHVRRLGVALEDVTLAADGRSVEVSVRASFEAGNSLESERECVDAIVPEARVPIAVEVLVIAGDLARHEDEVAHGASYASGCEGSTGFCLNPDPQPDPDLADRPLDPALRGLAAGWSAFAFTFHDDDPDGRGAYLRTLSLGLDTEAGWASGHATNYSPFTQLSGFDYAFAGTVVGVALDDAPRTGEARDTIPAELDAQGRPTLFRLPL